MVFLAYRSLNCCHQRADTFVSYRVESEMEAFRLKTNESKLIKLSQMK